MRKPEIGKYKNMQVTPKVGDCVEYFVSAGILTGVIEGKYRGSVTQICADSNSITAKIKAPNGPVSVQAAPDRFEFLPVSGLG